MKNIITGALLLVSFAAFGQTQPPTQTFNGILYRYVNSLRIDSNLFVPKRDTSAFNAALTAGGNIRWRPGDSLFYGYNGVRWTPFALGPLTTPTWQQVMTAGNTTTTDVILDAGVGLGYTRFSTNHATLNRWYSMTTGGGAFRPLWIGTGGLVVSDIGGSLVAWNGVNALQVQGSGFFSDSLSIRKYLTINGSAGDTTNGSFVVFKNSVGKPLGFIGDGTSLTDNLVVAAHYNNNIDFITTPADTSYLPNLDMRIKHNGNVIIGNDTADTDQKLQVQGTVKLQAPIYVSGGYTGLVRNSTTGRIEEVDYPFVYLEDFGAVGNGMVDDRQAIQDAIDFGKPIMLRGKTYYVSGPLNISSAIFITGSGDESVIATDQNSEILNIEAANVTITNLTLAGNGRGAAPPYQSDRPNQHGIRIVGTTDLMTSWKNNLISNVRMKSLGGAAFYTSYHLGSFSNSEGGVKMINCVADNCFIGYYCDIRGEYNSFIGCNVYNCEYGYIIRGGNNTVNAAQINSNGIGFLAGKGINDGHQKIDGSTINHNRDYGIYVDSIANGYLFSGCDIYVNDIFLKADTGTRFIGCDIHIDTLFAQNSIKSQFQSCKFVNSTEFFTSWNGTSNSGTPSDVLFFGNQYLGSTAVNNMLERPLIIKGSGSQNLTLLPPLGDANNGTFIEFRETTGVSNKAAVYHYNDALLFDVAGSNKLKIPGTGSVIELLSIKIVTGAGSPEGVVTAPVGSYYTNTSGGAGTTLYIKESGSGNTGWIAK